MEFAILGALEIRHQGVAVPLRRPKQRALLALLLLHANELVSSDRLLDLLWGESPGKAAGTALRGLVGDLRKLLGRELIETRPPGYLLRLAPEQLDLTRCERLLAEARDLAAAPARAERLREALALFRGEPLADLAGEGFLQGEIARLDGLRRELSEEWFEAELQLGRSAELVGELEALVAQYPLRERLRGQLMLALYRAGRQAEALERFRELRELLADELGLEPDRALRRLEQQILTQDPALDPAPALELPTAPALREERKRVSVLAWELPEDAAGVEAAERFGGTVERLPGGMLLSFFGAPLVHEDDPERAVRAALAAGLRAGVATGEAIVAVGERPQGEPLVAGEPVSLAVRLLHAAAPGAVLVDAPTYRATAEAVEHRRAEPLALGAGRPEPLWRALRIRARARARRTGAAAFVGREHELALLVEVWRRGVEAREPQLVGVVGPPGIGKTRLLEEFKARLEARGEQVEWRRGRCLPYGEGISFWALAEIVKAQADVRASDSSSAVEKKLGRGVRSLIADEREATWVELHLRPLVGLPGHQDRAPDRAEVFAAWRSFLEAAADTAPLALVVEDLHWADEGLLAFLDEVVERSSDVPLLVCCTARPELFDRSPGWGGGKRNASIVSLAPLGREETARLLSGLLERVALPDETQAQLLERAGGNPLYAQEFARMLAGRRRGAAEVVPETLQALIAARLDTLAPERKALLQDAAVLGRCFWAGALAALADRRPAVVEEQVLELARREFVRPLRRPTLPGEREHCFLHSLIREVAYAQIPRTARAAKHKAAGEWLEQGAEDRLGDYADQLAYDEIVGYHFEQAFHYRRALGATNGEGRDLAQRARERLAKAGRRALAHGNSVTASSLLRRALELYEPDEPTRAELLVDLAQAAKDTGDLTSVEALLGEALSVAEASGQERLGWRVRIERAWLGLHLGKARGSEALAVAREAVNALGGIGDDFDMSRAWRGVAEAHYVRGEFGAMEEALEHVLFHARRAGDRTQTGFTLNAMARVAMAGPTHVDEAIRRCEQLAEEGSGDVVLTAFITSELAYLEAMRGRFDVARTLYLRSQAVFQEFGQTIRLATVAFYSGAVELLAGDLAAAERELRRGFDTLEEMGERGNLSSLAALLAEVLYAAGRDAEAERYAAISERATFADDVDAQVRWRAARAKLCARSGSIEESERLAREAVDIARETDYPNLQADALVSLALALRAAGRAEQAEASLGEAIDLYRRKGNKTAAEWAAALFEQRVPS